MTPLRKTFALMLLVVCVLLAAGCAGQFSSEKSMSTPSVTDTPPPVTTVPVTFDAAQFQRLDGVVHIIAKGDYFNISGFSGARNATAVALWMFGNNSFTFSVIQIQQDGSYRYEITDSITRHLESGSYYIVIQHQGDNEWFDITSEISGTPGDYDQWVVEVPDPYAPDATRIFKIDGDYSITGYLAAKTLVQTLKDPRIDEYSSVIQVFVEDPWITIDAIGNQTLGEPFTITGTTNLAEGNELIFDIYPSWYKNWCCLHDKRPCPSEDAMAFGTVKVSGETGGINRWILPYEGSDSFRDNLRKLPAEEYYVGVTAIPALAENSTTFHIVK
jgi:hypothetical protein